MNDEHRLSVRKKSSPLWLATKAVASLAFICGAAFYLLGGSFRETLVYDRTVDEVAEQRDELVSQRLRVGGKLVEGSHHIPDGTTDHEFVIQGKAQTLRVRFTGLWPNAATDGRELMIEGVLSEDGVVIADRVLARCPSRYKARVSEDQEQ